MSYMEASMKSDADEETKAQLRAVCKSFLDDLQKKADKNHISLKQALDQFIRRLTRADQPLAINLFETWGVSFSRDIPVEQLVWNHGAHFSSKQSVITQVEKIHPDVRDFT